MERYEIEPANTYNMDEKGSIISFIGKSKKIIQQMIVGEERD